MVVVNLVGMWVIYSACGFSDLFLSLKKKENTGTRKWGLSSLGLLVSPNPGKSICTRAPRPPLLPHFWRQICLRKEDWGDDV